MKMTSVKDYHDIKTAGKKVVKEVKNIQKRRGVSEVEKTTLGHVSSLALNVLKRPDSEKSMQNILTALKSLIESKKINKKNQKFFEEIYGKLQQSYKAEKKDENLDSINQLLNSTDPKILSEGFLQLSRRTKEGWDENIEVYTEQAIEAIESGNIELEKSAAMFILQECVYKKAIFNTHKEKLLNLLKSENAQVRALIILICFTVKETYCIGQLIKMAGDKEKVNVLDLEIPEYMLKFPHSKGSATIEDIARDTVFEIVSATGDTSNYVTMSVNYSLSGTLRENEEFSLVFKICPIVNMDKLSINLGGLKGSFDLVGQSTLTLTELKINQLKEVEVRLIPEGSGHLKGTVTLETSNRWRGEILIDAIFNPKIEKREINKMENRGVTTKSESNQPSQSRRETNIEILIKDIHTMEVTKVVNALEELKNYAKGDEITENRISALSVTFSLKGTDKISKAEMDKVMELAENIKHRM
jgi:hypothetical protein